MNIRSAVILGFTALLLGGVVTVTFFHTSNRIISHESSAQICCGNITTNSGNITLKNNSGQISFARGDIASLQNNDRGNLAWIASGSWNISMSSPNQTSFNAKFNMIRTDSSDKHKYRISDFSPTNHSVGASSYAINGTATVLLAGNKLTDVPISITIMNGEGGQIIKIWINPSSVQNHFGDTPIYGTVNKLVS